MSDWQRRRHPRSEFDQSAVLARFRQDTQVAPPNLITLAGFQWAPRPPAARHRDPRYNNAAYKPSLQDDGPWIWFRADQQNPPRLLATAAFTWAPRTPAPPARNPLRNNAAFKPPFQDGPLVWYAADQALTTHRDPPYSLRPLRRSVQQYRQLEDWARFSGLAPPLGPDTNQINLDTRWDRTAKRRSVWPSTATDDAAWIWRSATPTQPPFDPSTQFAALDQFAARVQYRTGRKPTQMGGGASPPAPPFDTTLTVALDPFSTRSPKRKPGFDVTSTDFRFNSEDFGVPLGPELVEPGFETFWSRPPTNRRTSWATTQQDGPWIWFVTTLAPPFDPKFYPPVELFFTRPPKRGVLYPHTEQQQGWVTSPLTTNIAATYPFADRLPRRKGLFPSTEQQGGLPPPFDPVQTPLLYPLAGRPPKRPVLYPHTQFQDGWLQSVQFPVAQILAGEQWSTRPPRRKGLYPNTEQQDGWVFKALPSGAPFDPKQTPFLYPLSPRTPKRPVLYPHTVQQDGWHWFSTQPGTGGPGGGFSPPVSRWQIQYMDEVAPLRPEPTNLDAAAAPTLLSIPGPSVQFQDIVEPPIAPPNPTPTEPEGIASLLVRYPTDPYRRQQLPEMGTVLAFQEPFYPSGSVLSWQPVYEGHAGLPPVLHPFGPATVFATIVTPSAPPGTAAYAARYPDRVGREPGRGYPNYGPSITWTPIPITPPAPPTQRKKTDLRRREQLGIRRTIY